LTLSATALSACTGDGGEPLPARVTAFLQDDVAAPPAPIEQRIRALPGVTAVEFITKEQAYERLRESFKDRPDLLEEIRPDTLPASLEVTITDGSVAEAVELVIGALEGIRDTALGAGDGAVEALKEVGVLVRLTDGVTREQRDAIEKRVRELPRTEGILFETPEQARDRLRERCRGKGELAASFERVSLLEIPASFRFRIGPHGGKIPELTTLQDLDGIEDLLFVPAEVV
jgi:cell division protein FtsX